MNVFSVAMGGALGAVARYGLGIWISNKWTHDFPLHTFLINITGAFLLGFLNTLFLDKLTLSPEMRLAMTVGFLGAFTTFSTFGYETIMLLKDGNILTAGIYTLVSIIIGFLGVFLGMGLARLI
ncbi:MULTISPECIES: fluoride efflux transporter CrcB [Dehalobacter]|uniref:Fluoride-specific ion channel FluC n=3 Tax=Dehalobacter restrictus TaxID=55583 RepID=A0A857DNC8_9FIRM|nr:MULTISPECIES: fluoride efflux transporter CrcB [Dehalobacter]AHF08926.1 camphor resistance protein CrcB [Dehalobacter restrictus DSM 9455]MCG1026064.1 fluoride efflux transporter CrcB [Dehalobacter sp.]OCZ50930.1 camphor resistance protein CrcB [Dehalobacter sp. TeCB1]QHA01839.1 fluoride efflux transporter CrcB [Dehalobacter restrictus]